VHASEIGKVAAYVLPLGVDTFAIAAAVGAAGLRPEARRRVAALFVAFEAGMPLAGLALELQWHMRSAMSPITSQPQS
jgi:hypothetical protein